MAVATPKIVLVDSDPGELDFLSQSVADCGWTPLPAPSLRKAFEDIRLESPDAILTESPNAVGLPLFEELRKLCPRLPIVITSDHGNLDMAMAWHKAGAFDYLTKPVTVSKIAELLRSLENARQLGDDNHVQPTSDDLLVGCSDAVLKVNEMILRAAAIPSIVFLQGEDGTGKERVARAIHGLSERARHPFVSVTTKAISAEQMELALLGSEHAAGAFERVGHGTLFIDEISLIPGRAQAAMVQILQGWSSLPAYQRRSIQWEGRLIAATSRDLSRAIESGTFREDLFYQLHVLPIYLPPLRERPEDIPLLVLHFAKKLGAAGYSPREISGDAMKVLLSYPWPGNVQELRNCVEQAFAKIGGPRISAEDLPRKVQGLWRWDVGPNAPTGPAILDYELAAIKNALYFARKNKRQAARILGISIATLYKKIKTYQIGA